MKHDTDHLFSTYFERFDVPAPVPASINRAYVAEVVAEFMAKGQPVPADFGWWDDLPPDAVACASVPTPPTRD